MTRRVWVLPTTGFPGPEGTAGDALDKSKARGRDAVGSRRLRRLRGKAKRSAQAGLNAAPGAASQTSATDESS
jgi:hypothetical protein